MNAAPAYPHEAPPAGNSAVLAADFRALVPVLETPRLILRAPRIEDFEAYREILMSDRAIHMDGPFTRIDAWLDFTQCVANWMLRGHGLWTIEERDSGAVLGFTLICMEFGDQDPELGWFLSESAEGKGYAFEAAKAARDHGINTLNLDNLVSYIDPPNARSVKLAEKLGAVLDPKAAEAFDVPVLVYRHWPKAVAS